MEGELPSSVPMDRASDAAMEAFVRALDQALPPSSDDALRRELATECATVLDAFSRATDPVGVREAMALAGLLARRTAELGASGIVLGAVIEALLVVVGEVLGDVDARALRGLMLEGYSVARLERDREKERDRLVGVTRPFVIAPRCVALVLQGGDDAEWIAGAGEGLGPMLLRADARAVIVRVHLAAEPSDATLAELSALVDVAAVVGARVFFDAVGDLGAPLRARLGERATVVDDAASAFAEALDFAGESPTEAMRSRVAGLLKRLGV